MSVALWVEIKTEIGVGFPVFYNQSLYFRTCSEPLLWAAAAIIPRYVLRFIYFRVEYAQNYMYRLVTIQLSSCMICVYGQSASFMNSLLQGPL